MSNKTIYSPVGLTQSGRLGFLLKDSAIYGGAAALSKAFSLITFPLLARHFATEEYGVIDFFGVLLNFLVILIIFGQDSAVARYFYEHEDLHKRRRLVSQSLFFQFILMLFVTPLLWISTPIIAGLLIEASNVRILFRLILIQMPFIVLVSFSQNLLKWTFRRSKFLVISLGSVSLNVLLMVSGVYLLDIDVAGLLVIGLITHSLFGFLGLWFIRDWLILPRDFLFLRELLPYALPLGIVCVAGAFVPTIERWLTSELLGSEDLGLYAAGTRVAMLIALFVGAFQTAWGPFYLSLHKQTDAIQTYNWILKIFSLTFMLIVFALSAIAYPLIVFLATDRYASGAIVIFPLAMGLMIQATGWITEIGISISKRSHLNIYAYVAYVSVTAGMIFLLTPWFGLLGVGLGVLFGHAAKSGFATWLAQKSHPMAWAFKPVLLLILSGFLLGSFALWSTFHLGPEWGVISFSGGLLVLAVVGPFILFNSNERHLVSRSIKIKLGLGS